MSYFRACYLNIWLLLGKIETSQKYLYEENKYFFESAIEKYNKIKLSIDYIWGFAKRLSKAMLKTLSWKEICAIMSEFIRKDVWEDSKNFLKSLKNQAKEIKKTRCKCFF